MAASGYTPISLYYSITTTNTPSASNLVNGELAINITDGKLFYKDNTGSVQVLATKAGATGTVSSVALTVPSFLSVTGSPITTSGTLAISLSGTALPIANGGTGQTTASAAFNALSPITSTGDLIIGNGTNSATRLPIGANTYVLTSNGTTATWAAATGGVTSITGTSNQITASSSTGAVTLSVPSTFIAPGSIAATTSVSGTVLTASNGIIVNSQTVAASYSIPSGSSAMSTGPITVASGITVTVPSGSRWVIL